MKKSVLFICADQWRWDCFGFMKHKNAVTPNLDELAKKSTVFKSHFAGIAPSHRMIHQERQLSNTKLSSTGIKIDSGPQSRKVLK